jgi:hypothetical protein
MRTQLHAIRNRKPTRRLQLFCGLPGGFRVHSDFLGLIKRSVREVMPFLWHGNEYATEKLLGTKFWCALNGAEARMAELCLAEMVGRGEVALRVTSRDHDGAVRYTVA